MSRVFSDTSGLRPQQERTWGAVTSSGRRTPRLALQVLGEELGSALAQRVAPALSIAFSFPEVRLGDSLHRPAVDDSVP